MTDQERIAKLERQVEVLTQQLDQTRRSMGLPGIIDAQLLAINSRQAPRGNAA